MEFLKGGKFFSFLNFSLFSGIKKEVNIYNFCVVKRFFQIMTILVRKRLNEKTVDVDRLDTRN